MTGSIRRTGADLRINAELLDAKTGVQLWSDRFDGAGERVLSVQDSVCARITSSLKLHFAPTPPRQSTSDPAA